MRLLFLLICEKTKIYIVLLGNGDLLGRNLEGGLDEFRGGVDLSGGRSRFA